MIAIASVIATIVIPIVIVYCKMRARKQQFRLKIERIRNSVLSAQDERLFDRCKSSIDGVRSACAEIERDINNIAGFRSDEAEYIGLTRQDIECRDEKAERPASLHPRTYGNWMPPPRFHLGRERIESLLNALIDHAK